MMSSYPRRLVTPTNPNEAAVVSEDYYGNIGRQQQHLPHSHLPTSTAGTAGSNSQPPLASKPHAFRGAVLSPDHARNLTPEKALQLASALSAQASAAAFTKGVLPPGESVNLFHGCDMVDLLVDGMSSMTIGIGGNSNANSGSSAVNQKNAASVFRSSSQPPPASPKSPDSTRNQQHARIINLLHNGGGGGSVGIMSTTSSSSSTPNTPKNNFHGQIIASSPMSTASLSNAAHATTLSSSIDAITSNHTINPLSLLSTAEALESFGSWRTHYTVWITEAWNILQWSEPSAALFWEMANMYHTLYVASLSFSGGGSGAEARARVLGIVTSNRGDGAGTPHGSAGSAMFPSKVNRLSTAKSGGGITVGGSDFSHIPPILSCGSQSSMGSEKTVATASGGNPTVGGAGGGALLNQSHHHQQNRGGAGSMKPARHSAKELPVWLIAMFLLVHCEDEAFLRCTSGDDERRFVSNSERDRLISRLGNSIDFQSMLLHRSLSPRTRLHAGTHQNHGNCALFLLRHLRKFLLLCAVPRNLDACKAIATLAMQKSGSGSSSAKPTIPVNIADVDIRRIEHEHLQEHGNIGLNIKLTLEELDRLNLIMQAPNGGPVEEPPIAIGEHILKCVAMEDVESRGSSPGPTAMYKWNMMQNGLISLADAERILRRYLVEELSLAKQESNGGGNSSADYVTSKLAKLSMTPPPTPPRARGISLTESTDADNTKDSSYFKELSYQNLSSTTVLLEPGKEGGGNTNDANSVVSFSSQQNPCPDQGNESGRLHDLRVTDCSDTHFYLLQPFEHAKIAACTDCTIVIGAVAGVLQVVDCERTTITSAARRVIVSNSCDVVHYIFTPSPPLLVGDNRGCQFAPYNTYYDGLRDDLLATGLAAALRNTSSTSGGGSVAGDTQLSPVRGAETGRSSPSVQPMLQCASNKWKLPVELSKLELPQLPSAQSAGSSEGNSVGSPGADDRALGGSSADLTMKTPILLPASEFDVLLVPVENEEARIRRRLLREAQTEAIAKDRSDSSDNEGEEGGEGNTVHSNMSSITGERDKGEPPRVESDYCCMLADLLSLSPFHMSHDYERRVIAKAERVRVLQQTMQELNDSQKATLQEELNRGFQDWLATSGNLRQVLDLVHLEKKVSA